MTSKKGCDLCGYERLATERSSVSASRVCGCRTARGVRRAADPNQVISDNVPATCTTASALSHWDRDLIYELGQALGEDIALNVDLLLGPA